MNQRQNNDDPRIRLAAERTLLAWLRTSLALMGFGFVVAKSGLLMEALSPADGVENTTTLIFAHWIGIGMVAAGAFATLISGIQHFHFLKLRKGQSGFQTSPFSLSVILSFVMSVFGIAIMVYLFYASF